MVKIPTNNYILEYWQSIQRGESVTGQKVRKVIERLAEETQSGAGKYHFDPETANRPVWFIEHFCRTSKGTLGKPIKLELFQKAFIAAIYGFIDDEGTRRTNEAFLVLGRKNGKSTLTSALGLYALIGDKEGAPEIDCVSTKRDAAKIVFDEARNMVRQSPYLSKMIRKRQVDMYCDYNFGTFRPLSSESSTLDGLNPSFACLDECHAIKDRNLYDVIKQAMTARRQPLLLTITTSGFYRNGIYDNLYSYAEQVINGDVIDEHFLPLIYELDDSKEWTRPKSWAKANPGLGTIKSAEFLADNVKRAQSDASFKPTVLTKDFNLKNVTSDSWLTWDQLYNPATFSIDEVSNSYAIAGCDLSAVQDLSAATLLIRKPSDQQIYVLQQYFLPESRIEALDATASKEAPYKIWAEKGLLTICPGTMIDYSMITAWFKKMQDEHSIDIWRCGYDRALAGYWQVEMADVFGASVMQKVAQGPFTFTSPMKELAAMLTDKRINYNDNPILKWCLSNTGVKTTGTADAIQPIKIQSNRRIDGMVSLLNAYVIYTQYRDDYLNTVG